MAAQPLISCIVPVFNGECYLREALESTFAQTYRPIEAIVVDDGSTDGTEGVAASYGRRLRYLWQPNAGPAAARNRGLDAARGEFVAFLDADDLWHPEKLARQMARFVARPELEVCLGHAQNFWSPELAQGDAADPDARLMKPWAAYSCGVVLARRSVFDRVGPFTPELRVGEDGDWFLRAAERGTITEVLPDVLLRRRLHEGNLTRRMASASREALLKRVKSSLDRRRGK